MADDGLVSATIFINKKYDIVNKPLVTLNGFATPEKAKVLQEQIKQKCDEVFKQLTLDKDNFSIQSVEKIS